MSIVIVPEVLVKNCAHCGVQFKARGRRRVAQKYCGRKCRDAARRIAYREVNREKEKARNKAYREANPEKMMAKNKAYYEANREKIAAQKKAYREVNREKIAARKKAYDEANREKVAAWSRAYSKANPEKVRAYRRKRRTGLAQDRILSEADMILNLFDKLAMENTNAS